MDRNKESHTVNSEAVENQLDQLEEQNAAKGKNTKGSTNEIQPMATDEGLTQ